MESIWEDLISCDEQIYSPTWHKTALKETSQRYAADNEEVEVGLID